MVARIDGTPVTVGAVREIQRVTGAGKVGAGAALDLAIDGQLLYTEAMRRRLGEEQAVAEALDRDGRVLLVEQHVLATRAAELRKAREPGIHSSPEMRGPHGGMMSEAAQLKELVERLEKEAAQRAAIEFFPDVYQNQNWSGLPRGQLAVARIGGELILWSEVEELVGSVRGLEPPLNGIPAYSFVSGIRRVAGRKLLQREAEAALPTFRDAYERARERLVRAVVTRRLLALEVDGRAALGDPELTAYFEAHRDQYAGPAGPATFEQVRAKVAVAAEREAKTTLRAALTKRLRAGAKIEIDQPLLESLGK
ncbi:MAG: hypothetical protein HY825_00370 [Acidobacteria bacterium]|nr:hypothetical protein [Acidobacteriota bacterium]